MSSKEKEFEFPNYYDFMCPTDGCKQSMKWQWYCENKSEVDSQTCPECGASAFSSVVVLSGKRAGYFNSLSNDEKKKSLLARSSKHFNKKIKGYKDHLNNEIRRKDG